MSLIVSGPAKQMVYIGAVEHAPDCPRKKNHHDTIKKNRWSEHQFPNFRASPFWSDRAARLDALSTAFMPYAAPPP